MKKFLLVTCAFAACMGASAQHLQKAPFANQTMKLSDLNAVQFNGVAKKAPAKKVDTKSFIGIFVNNSWDEEKEINFSTTDTLYTANVQDQQGNTLNVKWNIYGNSLGHVYGKFDEATNTFTVPMQQYFGDGAPIDLGDEQSPIVSWVLVPTTISATSFASTIPLRVSLLRTIPLAVTMLSSLRVAIRTLG